MTDQFHQKLTYVPALDGLRAIAVLSVFALHLGVSAIPGGFIGVDVFFVISGYLMMRIILDDMHAGCYSPARFLWRRFKRLAPALFATVAVTLLVASLLYLPTDFEDVLKTGISANLFVSNFYYWLTVDYFATAAALAPFLHTWSLGVEAQFYLALPLGLAVIGLLGLANPRKAPLFFLLAAAMIASFAFNIIMVDILQKTTGGFYFPATRFWELLLGSLAAFVPRYMISSAKRSQVLAMSGALMIGASFFLLNEQSTFPGLRALLPCYGTVLLLLSLMHRETLVSRALATGPMVYIGKISYSLYLWHLPVIVIYKYVMMRPLGMLDTAVIFTVAMLMASLSYQFIERPYRGLSLAPQVRWRSTGQLLIPVLAVALAWTITNYREDDLRSQYAGYFSYMAPTYKTEVSRTYGGEHCFVPLTAQPPLPADCLSKSEARPNVLLVGDSHAAHLLPGLKEHLPNVNILQSTVAGCRALIGRQTAKGQMCLSMLNSIFGQFLSREKPELIVIAGRWKNDDLPSLRHTLQVMKSTGQNVVLVGPAIEYLGTVPSLLVRNKIAFESGPGPLDAMLDPKIEELDQRLATIATKESVSYISSSAALCPTGKCDVFVQPGVPFQWDYGHYTPEGSVGIVGRFRDRLRDALAQGRGRQIAAGRFGN